MAMSRETRIRSRLVAMNPVDFQILAQELVSRHYGYSKPMHRGTATCSDAPAPGTPDTFWVLSGGRFAYFECGHYLERDKAVSKIKDDIQKCLKAESEELRPGQLIKIVIVHACRRLTPGDISKMHDIDERVELIGPDEMSMMLVREYPDLAKDHLGIAIDTGQIMTLDMFEEKMERAPFASSLRTSLMGREREESEIMHALQQNQVVILHGKPGLGKTRLALEVIGRYSTQLDAIPLVISSNGQPIWDDLNNGISYNHDYVVLVDDANELSELSGLIDFVRTRTNVKLLLTVRNYARQYVYEKVSCYLSPSCIELSVLGEEAVIGIIESEFGIAHGRASASIARLSSGNLRLAYSASEAVKDKGIGFFSDMPDLIEACYKEPLETLEHDEQVAAGIVAILGAHRVDGNGDLLTLEEASGISHQEYINACRRLHEAELVDVCANNEAFAPGDQVLRDYLIYKMFYVDKSCNLTSVFTLNRGKDICGTLVSILINNFYNEYLNAEVEGQLAQIWDSAEENDRWELASQYGVLLGERALLHIKKGIEALPSSHNDYVAYDFANPSSFHIADNMVMSALCSFLNNSQFNDSEELFFQALDLETFSPDSMNAVLLTRMCFRSDSYARSFSYQRAVIDRLIQGYRRSREGKYAVLFIHYAQELMKPSFTGPTRFDGNKVLFIRGDYVLSEGLESLRGAALRYLFELRCDSRLTDMCDKAVSSMRGIRGDLWCVTLKLAYREYVCRIDGVSHSSFYDFAKLEKEMIELKIIDQKGFEFLHCNPSANLACQIALYDPFDEESESYLNAMVDGINSECFLEALTFFDLSSSAITVNLYALEKIVNRLFLRRGSEMLSMPEAYISCGVPPRVFPDGIFEGWLTEHGPVFMREIVLSSSPAYLSEWLSGLDEARVRLGVDPSLAGDVIDGAKSYGEVISFRSAAVISQTDRSFFPRYSHEVLERHGAGSFALHSLVPNDYGDSLQINVLMDEESYRRVRSAFIQCAAPPFSTWDKKFIAYALENDPLLIAESVPYAASIGATHAFVTLGEEVWERDNAETLADAFWTALSVSYPSMDLSRYLFAFVSVRIREEGGRISSWLLAHSLGDGSMLQPFVDVAMELPYPQRVEYLVSLCESGLTPEQLKKVPFDISSLGASWSGSEMPRLRNKIECIEEVLSRLEGIRFLEHRVVLQEARQGIERYMKSVEVEEFIRPF